MSGWFYPIVSCSCVIGLTECLKSNRFNRLCQLENEIKLLLLLLAIWVLKLWNNTSSSWIIGMKQPVKSFHFLSTSDSLLIVLGSDQSHLSHVTLYLVTIFKGLMRWFVTNESVLVLNFFKGWRGVGGKS